MSYIVFNKQHSKVFFDVKNVKINAKYLILDIARNSRWRKELANTLEIDQIFRSLLGINIGYWPRLIRSRQHRTDQYSFLKTDLTEWYRVLGPNSAEKKTFLVNSSQLKFWTSYKIRF